MKSIKFILFLSLLLILSSCSENPIPAPDELSLGLSADNWVSLGGPQSAVPDKLVYDIAVDNENIYLATNNGIYTFDSDDKAVVFADNDGLDTGCTGSLCTLTFAVAADPNTGTLYAARDNPKVSSPRLEGPVYRFDGSKWQMVSAGPVSAIAAQNGTLYTIQPGDFDLASNGLFQYLPDGEIKQSALYYIGQTGYAKDLDCFSLALHPISGTVFFACSSGIYYLDPETQKVESAALYGNNGLPFIEKISAGIDPYMLIGASSEMLYGVKIFSHTYPTKFEPLDDLHIGPFFNQAETGFYLFDQKEYKIFNYNGGYWDEIADASDLLTYSYKKVEKLCYLADDKIVYGISGSDVVEFPSNASANEYTTGEFIAKCEAFSDDLGKIDTETVYGNIIDYHRLNSPDLILAVTDSGHVVYKLSGKDWRLLEPAVANFKATSIAIDTSKNLIFVSTQNSGLFSLQISNK